MNFKLWRKATYCITTIRVQNSKLFKIIRSCRYYRVGNWFENELSCSEWKIWKLLQGKNTGLKGTACSALTTNDEKLFCLVVLVREFAWYAHFGPFLKTRPILQMTDLICETVGIVVGFSKWHFLCQMVVLGLTITAKRRDIAFEPGSI